MTTLRGSLADHADAGANMSAPARAVWAAAAPSPLQDPAWFEAAGWTERCSLLTDRQGLAVVPVWSVPRDGHYFHDPVELLTGRREAPFLDGLAEQASSLRREVRSPSVVTMSPYGYRGGAAVRPAAIARGDALCELAAALIEHARASGAQLSMAHYLFDDDEAWLDALVSAGGLPLVVGADSVLDVRWDSMASYYRWLGPSRRSLRREAQYGADLAWTLTPAGERPDDVEHVVDLLAELASRFDPSHPPPRSLLTALVTGSGIDRLLFTVGPPGSRPRSAVVVLRRGDTLYPKFFGTRVPRTDYFPLVYARVLSYAIATGTRRIEYGGGSHHAKLFRGCRLRPARAVLFVHDERLRATVEALARAVSARKTAHFSALACRWEV